MYLVSNDEGVLMKKKAVIVLSGGLDSTTCLAIAKQQGYECYALTFNYGQRLYFELAASKVICEKMTVAEHKIINIDLNEFKGSALTDMSLDVPLGHTEDGSIPITYVPARNTVFLSIALAWAEVLGAFDIFIGVNSVDYANYPDCRLEYIQAFEKMANLGTRAGIEDGNVKINTPLINLTKAEIIKLGHKLGVNYRLTLSCYQPDENGSACGICSSCILRKQGFAKAGISDPTVYQSSLD